MSLYVLLTISGAKSDGLAHFQSRANPSSHDSLLLVTVSQNEPHLILQNYSLLKSPMAIWWHLCVRAACLRPKVCDWYGSQQRRMEVPHFKNTWVCVLPQYIILIPVPILIGTSIRRWLSHILDYTQIGVS